MKQIMRQKYEDPIKCPVCGRVLGEWIKVKGIATIRRKCKTCKKLRVITKKD